MINNAYNDNNAKLNSWIDNVRKLPFGIYKGNILLIINQYQMLKNY